MRRSSKKKDSQLPAAHIVNICSDISQNKVAKEAKNRVGNNKNIQGHIFELLFRDQYNHNPVNYLSGRKATLTKSPIAQRDDLICTQNNKVVKRFQLKDTISPSGVYDTTKRIRSGQYSRTNIVGTTETAKKVNAKLQKGDSNTKIRVKDSRISSKDTRLIAKKEIGANPLKNIDLVGHNAKNVAKGSAILGGAVSLAKNGYKFMKGKRDLDEGICNVAVDTGKSAITGAVSGAADAATTMVVSMTPAAPAAKTIGTAVGTVTGIATDKAINKITTKVDEHYTEKVKKQLENEDDAYGYLKRNNYI